MTFGILMFTTSLLRILFSIIAFYFALLFFIKIKRAKGTGFDLSQFIGLGIFSLFVGVMEILFTYYYYYIYYSNMQIFGLYLIAIAAGSLGLTGLIFLSEKMLQKTKYIFTIFSVVATGGIFFFKTVEDIQVFNTITQIIVAIVIILIFLHFLIVKTKGEIRRKMGWVVLGFIGIFLFYMLDTETGQSIIPLPKEITVMISMVGLVLLLIFLTYIFLGIETFTEFGWQDNLKELFIIAPSGITLFHHSFKKQQDSHKIDLITAGLTGVKEILAEMVQSQEKLLIVDHKDVKIIFEYGNHSTLALIAYENFRIYHSKLAQLIKQFEEFFQDIFVYWSGDTEVFRPSKKLIEEIFG